MPDDAYVTAVKSGASVRTSRIPGVQAPTDDRLRAMLGELADQVGEAQHRWDKRDYVHGLVSYPAMMVPQLQRKLVELAVEWDPSIERFYDPFVGSGTVMTEAMLVGRQFVGADINPLAVLICQVKQAIADPEVLRRDLERVIEAAQRDRSRTIAVSFDGRDKWFTIPTSVRLSRLRRAIEGSVDPDVRRFWWVILYEVIRLTSNARTSTVKLHIRPAAEIATRPDPSELFASIARSRIDMMAEFRAALRRKRFSVRGKYCNSIDVAAESVLTHKISQADMLMTSPPYGDNHTTVAYGQASFLALRWVPAEDVPGESIMYENTRRTDAASLGGSLKNVWAEAAQCIDRSPTLRASLESLRNEPIDRAARVAAFFKDLDLASQRILANLRPGALMIWTLGDRSVGGQRVPMDLVLRELFDDRATHIDTLVRGIPDSRKRMPSRNSISSTMSQEKILVLRRG